MIADGLDDKAGDPALHFEWTRVEALRLGMSANTTPIAPTIYASFFVSFPNESLRSGDNDTRRRFGGLPRTAIVGDPIRELQTDLLTIGYATGGADGDFGEKTQRAVEMLQEHFFAGGRGHKSPDGRVDWQNGAADQGCRGGESCCARRSDWSGAASGGGRESVRRAASATRAARAIGRLRMPRHTPRSVASGLSGGRASPLSCRMVRRSAASFSKQGEIELLDLAYRPDRSALSRFEVDAQLAAGG